MEPIWEKSALKIKVNGESWVVIADLHLGFELELARNGVYIPDRTQAMIDKVRSLGKFYGLLIAGDLKHSIGLSSGFKVRKFIEAALTNFEKVVLLPGNHDGGISTIIGDYCEIKSSRGAPFGDSWIFHGHAYPSEEASSYEFGVMGHVHPAIPIKGIGKVPVWVLAETTCEGLPRKILVLPAFNDMLGYGDLLEMRERGPVFPKCIDPSSTDILTLDGHYMGTLSFLSERKGLLSLT